MCTFLVTPEIIKEIATSHCSFLTFRRIQNLNGFSIGFFCSHSAHSLTLRRVQNLNGFSLRFFCSNSTHNMMLSCIQNLHCFSIGFFCSHSAHNVTNGRVHQLLTSVGLAQARPNKPNMPKNHRNILFVMSL